MIFDGVLNPKIFVGVAVVVLVAALGTILLVGSLPVVDNTDSRQLQPSTLQIEQLEIELVDIEVTRITQRSATIDIVFELSNPNQRSVIVQVMDYQLYERNYSDLEQIAGGQIGSRPGGLVEFSSNYYTLLGENSITLKDTITIQNSGNTPQLWNALETGTSTWRVSGTVFFNLSSMTSGQENELHFEFVR